MLAAVMLLVLVLMLVLVAAQWLMMQVMAWVVRMLQEELVQLLEMLV